jgi:hypothetical protein
MTCYYTDYKIISSLGYQYKEVLWESWEVKEMKKGRVEIPTSVWIRQCKYDKAFCDSLYAVIGE